MSAKVFQRALSSAVLLLLLTGAPHLVSAETPDCEGDLLACRKSCDGGSASSCTALAVRYRDGLGVHADRFKARSLLVTACEADYAPACLTLAATYRARHLIDFDDASARAAELRAEKLLSPACKSGDDEACHHLAGLYADRYEGTNSDEDRRAARGIFQRLCSDAKRVDSCAELTELYSVSTRECPPVRVGASESVQCLQNRSRATSALRSAAKVFLAKCLNNDSAACLHLAAAKREVGIGKDIPNWRKIGQVAANERACEGGQGLGCLRAGSHYQWDPSKGELAVAWFKKGCTLSHGQSCERVAQSLLRATKDAPAQPEAAKTWRSRACNNGYRQACMTLSRDGTSVLKKKYSEKARNRAIGISARACAGANLAGGCLALCDLEPSHRECRARELWMSHRACQGGDGAACELVAKAHVNGSGRNGAARDNFIAAMSLRQGCSSASSNSCMRLRKLCAKDDSLSSEACERSLIHSDLFYEAEQQFRTSGKASLVGAASLEATTRAVLSQEQDSTAPKTSARRGSLDADLVADVVLSRARQAALRLVVSELRRAMRGQKVPLYMRDLLGQGALLLADADTMRREKVEDLAMTVVRAFVASTLVRTLYPAQDAFDRAPAWASGLAWPKAQGPEIRRYLVDLAYRRLGETRVFERRGGDSDDEPRCPKKLTTLCEWLDGPQPERLEEALHVDDILMGLRLVKQIKHHGSLDFRRLIEALGRTTSIASFDGTAGLRIESWRREIVVDIKSHLDFLDYCMSSFQEVRDQVIKLSEAKREERSDFAQTIVKSQSYTTLRYVLGYPAPDLLFGKQAVESLSRMIDALGKGRVEEAVGFASFSLMWNEADQRSKAVMARVPDARKAVASLESAVDTLEQTLEGFQLSAGARDIGALSLHTIPVLRKRLALVLGALDAIDEPLQIVDGEWDGAKPFFAQRAIMRMLGLLDLIEKTASVVSLDETIEQVLARLRRLGATDGESFGAPLLDVLEPILGALESHRPLDADLLFHVISQARLDSLLASLTGAGPSAPCRKEGSSDCWTLKVLHSLQESIQRDGDTIRVDGSTFARRLAGHGDSFRRRHRGGFFFHLTVGMGGVYSIKPPATDMSGAPTGARADDRWAPLISEQVGFGYASPTFAADRLTAKVGLAASGVLYRMLLDSTESDAVMLAPFVALDVYDLVELYVAPGIWLYPPSGNSNLGTNFGVSVGLQVPLGAYLERVGK